MGFDLAHEPKIFPEIWTGDESRYAPITDQLPLLLMDHCGKGEWYVLNVPEEQKDFDSLHPRVLDGLRRFLASGLPVRLEGPGRRQPVHVRQRDVRDRLLPEPPGRGAGDRPVGPD